MVKQKSKTMHTARISSSKKRVCATKSTSKRHPFSFTWAEGVMAGIICICALCVGISVFADSEFDPERDATEALEELARDYYIEYLYPNTLGTRINDPASVLSRFVDSGLPVVRLRQLLLYDDEHRIAYAHFFANEYYFCDTNLTTLRYFPFEPYGPRDYTIEYNYSCTSQLNSTK